MRGKLRKDIKPFELPDKVFVKKFRLGKDDVRELMEDVRPYLGDSTRAGAITLENKV